MAAMKLRKLDDGVGAVFPEDMLARMNVKEGDLLTIMETPSGILLTPTDPSLSTEMEVARKVMRENDTVLRALAQ